MGVVHFDACGPETPKWIAMKHGINNYIVGMTTQSIPGGNATIRYVFLSK